MTAAAFQPRRSLIFAPGDKPEMLAKAAASGADMACLDLEDAVAPQHKAAARERTLALFASDRSGSAAADGVERIVRINPLRSPEGMKDVAAILSSHAPPPALMLTKVKTADEVKLLDEVLSEAQMPTRLHVIVETNDALENAMAIGRASPRIDAMLFGAVDLAAELRATYGWEPLLYARSRVANAAAAAGLDLVDVPWLDLADMDGMRREAELSRALGFTGKGAIHPKQIAPLNEIFTPKPADVTRARRIVSAFAQAGTGLVVIDGKLIERPVLRAMNRLVAVADAIGKR
jgi:(S)-citramalyl-CoA lyase